MKTILPPKSFYFIRHGQSEWNVLDQFAGGQTDTPLTDLGREQAFSIKEAFEHLSPMPTHIIHSWLSRAKETANILNQDLSLPMIERYDLREVDAGDWAGVANDIAKQRWADGLSPNNGENMDLFAKRIQQCFTDILSDDTFDIPFIAAHGRIINAINYLYGLPMRSLQVQNCQILRFEPSNKQPYPWNVFICTYKNGQFTEELAEWSQI